MNASSRNRSRWSCGLALALLAIPLLHACGTENGLVGGECRAEYTRCDDVCADLQNDARNCGACNVVCATGTPCGSGACGGTMTDATVPDADATVPDADADADSVGDGASRTDAPFNPRDAGEDADGNADAQADASEPLDACAPPFDSPDQCGACDVQCPAATPICRAGDAGYACAPVCEAPLTNCDGTCVDVMGDDPFHCGACNRFCPSFLCVDGTCEGTTPGEIVVLGHDFSAGVAGTSQARLLQNAVSIASRTPIRILSYEANAPAATVTRVKALLGALPRQLVFTASSSPIDLQSPTLAASYDVVLVYDQANADAATATALGADARTTLHDFAAVGGVIVALDGADGQGHMPEFLTAAELLAVSAHTPIAAGTPVYVSRVGDLVTNQVTSTYGVANRTVSFTTSEVDADPVRWVVRAGPPITFGEPIVVRKTVTLP